jgi:hypothetical protein
MQLQSSHLLKLSSYQIVSHSAKYVASLITLISSILFPEYRTRCHHITSHHIVSMIPYNMTSRHVPHRTMWQLVIFHRFPTISLTCAHLLEGVDEDRRRGGSHHGIVDITPWTVRIGVIPWGTCSSRGVVVKWGKGSWKVLAYQCIMSVRWSVVRNDAFHCSTV